MARRPVVTQLLLPEATIEMQAALPSLAEDVVSAVIDEVPSYTDAFSGPKGETIRSMVQLSLSGFLSAVERRHTGNEKTRMAPVIEGAYQLGQGEARSGRTSEALLSAYRIGAGVAWQRLSALAVDKGVDATTMAALAQAVWAYIDELSAASVAGHGDESATAGQERQRLLDLVARLLLTGAPEKTVVAAAERAEWTPPTTLTAVIVPESQAGSALQLVRTGALRATDLPELEAAVLLMVPDLHGRRSALLRAVEGRGWLVGPARPWLAARSSYDRALRARDRGLEGDTEAHLPELVLTADPDALSDLRAAVLAPLADLRPAAAAKLAETLRAWLLHQGRRDEIAAALFLHPQTIRYRMSQVRELFGDKLEDPKAVLALTIALGVGVDAPLVP